MGSSFMTTFQRAVDRLTAFVNWLYWRAPRKVRPGLRIVSRHCWDTGWASDGTRIAKKSRVDWGAVGARSGLWVCGLSQTWFASAFAERKERSSRKKTSRFL